MSRRGLFFRRAQIAIFDDQFDSFALTGDRDGNGPAQLSVHDHVFDEIAQRDLRKLGRA